jgi:predicted Fe-Mo cluster-binding NifX family protein
MKITFPTNDRKTIAKRTGRCKEFAVYDIENNTIKNIDYLENNHEHHDHGHGHGHDEHGHGDGHDHEKGEGEHSHDEIGEILNDTDVLIVGRVGKFMKKALIGFDIKFQVSKNPNIDEALENYLKS